MRLGLVLPAGEEVAAARLAEAHGLFGGLVSGPGPGQEMIAAAYAATATEALRIVVRVPLGSEQPVTLAEELAVLDNIAGGRLVVLADTGELAPGRAVHDLCLLREAWTGRALRPAEAGEPVVVTPPPAQVELPVWLAGGAAPRVAAAAGLPALARRPDGRGSPGPPGVAQPGLDDLSGDLEADRSMVLAWREAGATHLLLTLPAGHEPAAVLRAVSRRLAPEVSMHRFPRVVAESEEPRPWPPSR